MADIKNREQLKTYFKANATPTEVQFSELIDNTLNPKDDGIAKAADGPLRIEAGGEEAGRRRVVQFYETPADTVAEWTLSLRPRLDDTDVTTQRRGLAIADVNGHNRLFIDRATGNVGVGTIEPAARLHVAGALQVDGALKLGTGGGLSIPSGQPVSGIQVVDFMTVDFDFGNFKAAAVTQEKTITFSQGVVKAEVALVSYAMGFGGELGFSGFHNARIVPSCVFVKGEKTVAVTLQFGLSGSHTWSHGIASILVIAVLENAI
jgi:hypothetical protein